MIKRALPAVLLVLLLFAVPNAHQAQEERGTVPRTLLSPKLINAVINEVSGDIALQNETLLTAVNRNRLPEEYAQGYFETAFILKKLQEYGITDSRIVELPAARKTTWDAESAELWILGPASRKLADLRDIPPTLASGSSTSDVSAELVYVGQGNNERYFQDKDVKGKILLASGSPEMARRIGVEKHGALGIVSYAATHADFDPTEVLWSSIRPGEKDKPTFAFMIQPRLGEELRRSLERGEKVEVRAVCKAQQVPYREEMVEGLIRGKELPDEELVFSAHLFEGFAKQGANDDVSGCVAILETARALKALVDSGKIPPLKHSVRFLFVPEISGTIAYIQKFPAVSARFFADINEDMVGEALAKHNAFFVMKRTPASLPTCLNDVMAALIEWVGATQKDTIENGSAMVPIVSPTGTRDPFHYSIDEYYSGSDHLVFNDGGVRVPAVMLNVWPDQWYHTSGDTPDKSDSTQLKRAAFLGTAAAVLLAVAGREEAETMLAETTGRAARRLAADASKAESLVAEAKVLDLSEAYRDARNIVTQAGLREQEAVRSVDFYIRKDAPLAARSAALRANLDKLKAAFLERVEQAYEFACLRAGVKPQKPVATAEESRLARLVPVRTDKMRSFFNDGDFYGQVKDPKTLPVFKHYETAYELRNFIDDRRSILDIRNAVSAEIAPVSLKDVEAYVNALVSAGYVELKKK